MPRAPWKRDVGLRSVIEKWESEGSVKACIAADREFAATDGQLAGLPTSLHPSLSRALEKRGISRLYEHQVQAVEAARAGRHVVVATPTASGKSLCFHLPVLDALARDPDASALYLYPTKALSRDQEASLRQLIGDAELDIPAVVYDGDTPGDARRAARQRSPIIMTNPDMLHAGILPHHANWARTLQHLRYVVLDELHTYRGVFGSHVAHVLARLRRAAAFHGSKITFLCATATIGNPLEHAARILGVPEDDVELVDQSGAPRGPRRVFLYNPPIVNAELGIRASYVKRAVHLAKDLVLARVPTIVFGPSRNSVEIMLKYLREAVKSDAELSRVAETAIVAYRGGYLPETRRRVEKGLREGNILCVVATNALELGIDVGDLDAVVCAGYPGSIAETWQRFGRGGRRGKESVAVLVTASHAVDQYMARHPTHVLDGAIEHARIDPSNTEILVQHLKCAAFELPFLDGEAFSSIDSEETGEALGFLESHRVVHHTGGRYHWATDSYPANHVSLRSVGWDNFVIIDVSSGRALAELDWRATHTMLHEQAIYQHDGEQYQVERLDFENHKAYVRHVVPDYFTTAMTNRRVSVIDVAEEGVLLRTFGLHAGGPAACAPSSAGHGEVSVVEKVVGYKKIKFFTHENAGYGEVRLPDMQMHTTSFWWSIPDDALPSMGRATTIDGLRGVGRALETVATVALMCDPRDIGQTLSTPDDGDSIVGSTKDEHTPPSPGDVPDADVPETDVPETDVPKTVAHTRPSIFLFDNVPGGVGLAPRIYEQAHELLLRARDLLQRCTCASGCPLCVGATAENPRAMRKRASLALLDQMLLDS